MFATATAEIKRGVSTKGKYTIVGGLASVLLSDICTQDRRELRLNFSVAMEDLLKSMTAMKEIKASQDLGFGWA